MSRRLLAPITVCFSVLVLGGCSVPAEHPILERFFSASRLRDTTALSTIATVVFEPRERGTVLAFDVMDVRRESPDRKIVTVDASIRLPDGQMARKPLVVTLERTNANWMVTAVTDVPASTGLPSSPRS